MATYMDSPDSRLQPLLFSPLDADGTNFLEWLNNAKVVLAAEGLSNYLYAKTAEGLPDVMKWKTVIVVHKHLEPSLRYNTYKSMILLTCGTNLQDSIMSKRYFCHGPEMIGSTCGYWTSPTLYLSIHKFIESPHNFDYVGSKSPKLNW